MALFQIIEFALKLRDPRELGLKVALDLVDDLAAFVQRTDQRVELSARHIQPIRSPPHTADPPDALYRGSPLRGHVVLLDSVPIILLLSSDRKH